MAQKKAASMSPAPERLRILCLHGYEQNARRFRDKTGGFRKAFKKYAEFDFIDAPHVISSQPASSDAEAGDAEPLRGWWFSSVEATDYKPLQTTPVCRGFQESLRLVQETLARGPEGVEGASYDGVLAFSQGACLLSLMCALKMGEPGAGDEHAEKVTGEAVDVGATYNAADTLEKLDLGTAGEVGNTLNNEGNTEDRGTGVAEASTGQLSGDKGSMRFDFAMFVAGFRSCSAGHAPLYDPTTRRVTGLPTLHVYGDADQVIPAERSLALLELYDPAWTTSLRHDGGHFLPTGAKFKSVYETFLRAQVDRKKAKSS